MYYTYYCPICGKESEFAHGIRENPVYLCSEDNSVLKIKITGGGGILYKGDGWGKEKPKEKVKNEKNK